MTRTATPVRAVARGLVAGAVGTVAMDLLWYVRHRRSGGESGFVEWEFSAGLDRWEDAPAPAQVGKRVVEGLFGLELPGERARITNNVVHWLYGVAWGAQYGLVAGSRRSSGIGSGFVFGALVWASGYVVLPLAKLYKPMWEYDAKTLGRDLGAHVVYGAATAAAFRALGRR